MKKRLARLCVRASREGLARCTSSRHGLLNDEHSRIQDVLEVTLGIFRVDRSRDSGDKSLWEFFSIANYLRYATSAGKRSETLRRNIYENLHRPYAIINLQLIELSKLIDRQRCNAKKRWCRLLVLKFQHMNQMNVIGLLRHPVYIHTSICLRFNCNYIRGRESLSLVVPPHRPDSHVRLELVYSLHNTLIIREKERKKWNKPQQPEMKKRTKDRERAAAAGGKFYHQSLSKRRKSIYIYASRVIATGALF